MCGRFYVPEDDSVQMIRAVMEALEHRNVSAKTGVPWGYRSSDCQQ